jgi:hypothetical protein
MSWGLEGIHGGLWKGPTAFLLRAGVAHEAGASMRAAAAPAAPQTYAPGSEFIGFNEQLLLWPHG